MIRWSAVFWMLAIVVAAFMLYQVKYEVQSLRTQIATASRQLEEEKEALNVVAAEWAYLNRPERLQALADKYLSSSGLRVEQVADIEAIGFPERRTAALSGRGIQPASVRTDPDDDAIPDEDMGVIE